MILFPLFFLTRTADERKERSDFANNPTPMKFITHSFSLIRPQLFTVVAFSLVCAGSAFADEFSFKVENKTSVRIVQVLVSEDGETYGTFDIGRGIAAGQTVTLVWDKSTENENCSQYVKAVYADEEESEPAKFDFCEEDLELVFEE